MAEGIRSAAQKVAEYSFRAGVAGHKNEALPNWLENTVDAVLGLGKRAEVSTGSGNAGAEVAQTGANDPNQAANRPGQMPLQGAPGAQVAGVGAPGLLHTGWGLGCAGVHRGKPLPAQLRANGGRWRSPGCLPLAAWAAHG